jgi:peptidoglycan/xylan/chitin deacetylase (PgdA/CDA1 family)
MMSKTLLDNGHVRKILARNCLVSVDTQRKLVALTFDDGPNPRNTPALLKILERKSVVATFFLLGIRARQFPDIAQATAAAGHCIGSHSDRHLPLPFLPMRLIRREITQATDSIVAATEVRPAFCRPPYGWYSRRVLRAIREAGQTPVIGNVYPRDSKRPGAEEIERRVLRRIVPGSIVILHDGGWHGRIDRTQTLEAVDRITDSLGELGYEFLSLPALESSEAQSS